MGNSCRDTLSIGGGAIPQDLNPEVFTFYKVNMSYYTDSTLLQAMLEVPLQKIRTIMKTFSRFHYLCISRSFLNGLQGFGIACELREHPDRVGNSRFPANFPNH